MTSLDPFLHLTRSDWEQRPAVALPLTESDVASLSSTGDRIDLDEVRAVYGPLCALIHTSVEAARIRHELLTDFLGTSPQRVPFVIAVAGSVAVGKSTTARLLRELLSHWPATPRVDLVTTDGFLLPNSELTARHLMARKGFPESYNRRAFLDFMQAIKSGKRHLEVPLYDHLVYDITGETLMVDQPDILIIEGLNVLQPARASQAGDMEAVSDYFDLSIYVDADEADMRAWYVDRFLELKETAFTDPDSYFTKYQNLSTDEAIAVATTIWESVNLPNLVENIEPTRTRADVIYRKGGDHKMTDVYLRKP